MSKDDTIRKIELALLREPPLVTITKIDGPIIGSGGAGTLPKDSYDSGNGGPGASAPNPRGAEGGSAW